jgi:hypothetical protein
MALEDYFPWLFNSKWYRGRDVIGSVVVRTECVSQEKGLYCLVVDVSSDGTEHRSRAMDTKTLVVEAKRFLRHLGSTGYSVPYVRVLGLSDEDAEKALNPPEESGED